MLVVVIVAITLTLLLYFCDEYGSENAKKKVLYLTKGFWGVVGFMFLGEFGYSVMVGIVFFPQTAAASNVTDCFRFSPLYNSTYASLVLSYMSMAGFVCSLVVVPVIAIAVCGVKFDDV